MSPAATMKVVSKWLDLPTFDYIPHFRLRYKILLLLV